MTDRAVLFLWWACLHGSVDTQSYVLNFHGRVTHASVKNFQIVHDVDGTCVRFFLVNQRMPKFWRPVNQCLQHDQSSIFRSFLNLTGSAVVLIWAVHFKGWLGSRVVSVLDSSAEGHGFKLQPRCCRVTVLGKLFTPIMPLFTKQRNW